MKTLRWAGILISVYLVTYFLVIAKQALVPFVLAGVVCFFIIEIAEAYKRIPSRSHELPHGLALSLSLGTIGLVGFALVMILNANIHSLIEMAPTYQQKFVAIIEPLRSSELYQQYVPTDLHGISEKIDIAAIIRTAIGMATTFAENAIMITIYSVFILLEYRVIGRKLATIFEGSDATRMMRTINDGVRKYVVAKCGLNLLSGVLSYAAMAVFGLDFAALWGLLIFLLSFIPVIGGVVSFVLPVGVACLQFGIGTEFFAILGLLTAISFVVERIVEPKLMEHSLNLSSLAILLLLVFWGSIWGMTGMLLCIPITIVAKVVLANSPRTKSLAILLSADGRTSEEEW